MGGDKSMDALIQAGSQEATGSSDLPPVWSSAVFQNMHRRFPEASAGTIVKLMIEHNFHGGDVAWVLKREKDAETARILDQRNRVRAVFTFYDVDGDGRLSAEELKAVLNHIGLSDASSDVLFSSMDSNQNGVVEYDEFVDWVFASNTELLDWPELTLTVCVVSGKVVWGPGPIMSNVPVCELIDCFAEAAGQPAYKLKLVHGDKELPRKDLLGTLDISNGAVLNALVEELTTPTLAQLREGTLIRQIVDEEPTRHGVFSIRHEWNYYEWPQASGAYWCNNRKCQQGGMGDELASSVEGPFEKAFVMAQTSPDSMKSRREEAAEAARLRAMAEKAAEETEK